MTEERRAERLVGLAIAGALALNYPLLKLFDGAMVLGIPSLYLYVFAVWAALIALVAVVIERKIGPGRARAPARPDD